MKRTPLKRSAGLKPRSAKRSKVYRESRVPLVIALLEARPNCERCRVARSVDVHERKSRARGGSILDEANLVCLCRPCHSWVTENPRAAEDEGWSLPSWA
jgi:5-methylcytosine-specific restriction endonuclease McrA